MNLAFFMIPLSANVAILTSSPSSNLFTISLIFNTIKSFLNGELLNPLFGILLIKGICPPSKAGDT